MNVLENVAILHKVGQVSANSTENNTITKNLSVFLPVEQLTVSLSCKDKSKIKNRNEDNEEKHKCYGHADTLKVQKHSVQNGLPLTGNTVINVSLSVGTNCLNIKPEKACKLTMISFLKNEIVYKIITPPSIQNNIKANVTLDYVLRHVKDGGDTIEEADDKVEFISGTKTISATVLPRSEYKDYYGIYLDDKPILASYKNRHDYVPYYYVCFSTQSDAAIFVDKLYKQNK